MRRAWQLRRGVVALGAGIVLITGPAAEGILAGSACLRRDDR
jgi:hypothetical protein